MKLIRLTHILMNNTTPIAKKMYIKIIPSAVKRYPPIDSVNPKTFPAINAM